MSNDLLDNLLTTITQLDRKDELHLFLRDLLTEQELADFALRWQVARLLHNGHTYPEVQELTGLSTTTIARISRFLKEGCGGYQMALKKGAKKSKRTR